MSLEALRKKLAETSTVKLLGKVDAVTGLAVRFSMPGVRVGDVVRILRRNVEPLLCEIVGFDGGSAVGMPLGRLEGVGADDDVESTGAPFRVIANDSLLGRVVNGLGVPIDGKGPLAPSRIDSGDSAGLVDRDPPNPLSRKPISTRIATGVRVIDGLLTLGEGQRMGLFAGSGVGKSTLLGSIARSCDADVIVVGLVGERGREVGEFLEHALGEKGLARSIVVAATSDAPALERIRAAQVATAYAEYFRDAGKRVLLMIDSVTRFARAQREIGLAAGEPPARRGYPPSVFAMLPRLLERAGQSDKGSITAIYTVLVEGGDMDEPIADEVRGILDGHVVLDRTLAARGIYPAVDVTTSLSRVMPNIVTKPQQDAARTLRSLVSTYESKRDLILLGAYAKGSDKEVDEAIAKQPAIAEFLTQSPTSPTAYDETLNLLQRCIR
ncbi:MAG: FliI/YscN family ATPase [Polyangiaceae bacterium]|nr:FliI/YscN family ATPase [Polyangiaceae bacterium]